VIRFNQITGKLNFTLIGQSLKSYGAAKVISRHLDIPLFHVVTSLGVTLANMLISLIQAETRFNELNFCHRLHNYLHCA